MNWKDICLVPAPFCEIQSRKDVDPGITIAGTKLRVPIIASNMDTVYSPQLAKEAAEAGAIACVHRFCTVTENIKLFEDGIYVKPASFIFNERGAYVESSPVIIKPWVSVGINEQEFFRAQALVEAGAKVIVIDVANAACTAAVKQFVKIKDAWPWVKVVIGNFTTFEQIDEFTKRSNPDIHNPNNNIRIPDAIKISIGTGSACLTEKYTVGAGLGPIQTVLSCRKAGIPMIFDGGFTSPSDLNKCLALGCSAVMMGKQFAGTISSAGKKFYKKENNFIQVDTTADAFVKPGYSYYRGSAAADSYAAQGKTATWRPVEGKHSYVEITGTVAEMLQSYEAALRSAMTYCNKKTLLEYIQNVQWEVKNDISKYL